MSQISSARRPGARRPGFGLPVSAGFTAALAILAVISHVLLTMIHVSLFGGWASTLQLVAGTAMGALVAVLLLRLLLPMHGATWVTLWCGLTALALTGSLALRIHEAGAANRARIVLSHAFQDTSRTSLTPSLYGRWAPLLRTCFDLQHESLALRRRLGEQTGPLLVRNVPSSLMKRHVTVDPYVLGRAQGDFQRARQCIEAYREERERFVAEARARLNRHAGVLPPQGGLTRSFEHWLWLAVSYPGTLQDIAARLVSQEESILRTIMSDPTTIRTDDQGYPFRPNDWKLPDPRTSRDLENRVHTFLENCRASH